MTSPNKGRRLRKRIDTLLIDTKRCSEMFSSLSFCSLTRFKVIPIERRKPPTTARKQPAAAAFYFHDRNWFEFRHVTLIESSIRKIVSCGIGDWYKFQEALKKCASEKK
jgi:hypothetical protein